MTKLVQKQIELEVALCTEASRISRKPLLKAKYFGALLIRLMLMKEML